MSRHPAYPIKCACLVAAAAMPEASLAQRGEVNVVRTADDAFGVSVGRDSIGIYSPSSVRGFSPFAAGNVRFDGLYIDALVLPNQQISSGSNVRVGLTAQGTPFLAPSGVAEYRLRDPGDRRTLTFIAGSDSFGTVNAEASFSTPVTDTLRATGGVYAASDGFDYGGDGTHLAAGLLLRWQPVPSVEVKPFWGTVLHDDETTSPLVVVDGKFLPPRIERGRYFGQSWTEFAGSDTNYGVITRWAIGPNTQFSSGLFRSRNDNEGAFSDLFLGVDDQGRATQHRVFANPAQLFASTSGELRLAQTFQSGDLRHRLIAATWGRRQTRRYGGGVAVDLGPAEIGRFEPTAQPAFDYGPQARDRIEQLSAGLAYQAQWPGVGELTVGLRRTDYDKDTTRGDGVRIASTANPWLYSAALAAYLTPEIVVYGGVARGLEETAAAPDTAINRNEAPPALRTRQVDGGVRWNLTSRLRLVAGLFDVRKPYFSLDDGRIYRLLGNVRHRGSEISLTGALSDELSILAGALLLDAEVDGEGRRAGLVGKRAFGTAERSLTLGLDYRPAWLAGFSFDATVFDSSNRVANTLNTLKVPGSTTADLGLRYQWQAAGSTATLRLQLVNAFNAFRWVPAASNSFRYNSPRHLIGRLTFAF